MPDICQSLKIDFTEGKLAYRAAPGRVYHESVVKAVGIKPKKILKILDATAGLGRDAFIMASAGAQVTMIEGSKEIADLLLDAMSRAQDVEAVRDRMILHVGDSIDYINNVIDIPDVIYLDPMFPERQKSALVKKEMRILKSIVGDIDNAEALWQAAMASGVKRVVLKRPKLAPTLGKPTFSHAGKSGRFDVYCR